jgi:phosphotransferase system enzyme I (PtsI)
MSSTTLQGLPASPGIAVGRCWTVDRRRVRTPRRNVAAGEVEAELGRLEAAIELSVHQLDGVKAKMQAADGAEHLAILEVHRAMLRDPSLVDEVRRLVREEQVNVEWAVKRAIRKIKGAFDPDDEFFRERRSDVDYVGERIVKNLLGQGVDVAETPPPGSIVVARDLSPADTALLFHDRKVAGLVTDAGGITSHTAIVARALEIPAVVGAGKATATAERGDWVVVDGGRGVVVVNPSPGERADYEAARIRQMEREAELARLKDLPAETVDGVRLRMVGNIEFGEEVPGLLSHGGEGVGLYRTEFLFMGRDELPTEEDHYRDYRAILEAMGGRPVTVRTFDLGGDKLPPARRITRRIRRWACGRCATASATPTSSTPSCAPRCGRPRTATCASCSPW